MPTFAELMAYSKSQTDKQEGLAAELLKKKKEEDNRRLQQQALEERKERERQEKLRKKHFEDLEKEEQRKRDEEKARLAREAVLKRRSDEVRDRLLNGRPPSHKVPRARSTGASTGGGGGAGRPSGKSVSAELDSLEDSSMALTRQEKRDRKLQMALSRTYGNMNGRSKTTGGYLKSGRKLPGGAVDTIHDLDGSGSSGSSAQARSAKQRLFQMPNTLTKLNTVKRDTRTIDEILRDRAKAKSGEVLEGDKAKQFDEWFTPAKRTTNITTKPKASPPASSRPVMAGKATTSSSAPATARSIPSRPSQHSSVPSKSAAPSKQARPTAPASAVSAKTGVKRRQRSMTPPEDDGLFTDEEEYEDDYYDDDMPPPKRRATGGGGGASSLGDTIWQLFGKSRSNYIARDVFSDDEDMEADARVLEAEERSSARFAKKEDQEALEEERKHEAEKRRKKKLAAARGAL